MFVSRLTGAVIGAGRATQAGLILGD